MRKWYFYSYTFNDGLKSGGGNGMARFKKKPSSIEWITVARKEEKRHHLKPNCLIINFYQSITK